MTTQLRTTPTSAASSNKPIRKAAKHRGDETADQFGPMFASLCVAPKPKPEPKPAAKPQDVAPAGNVTNPETTTPDSTTVPVTPAALTTSPLTTTPVATTPLTPDKGLEIPALGTLTEVSELDAKDVALPLAGMKLTPAVEAPQIAAPSTAPASPSAEMAEKILAAPTMILLPRVNTPAAATTHQVDPTQPAADAVVPNLRSSSAVEAPVAQGPLVVVNVPTEQTLQSEAVRREANLVAGYLANSTRTEREGNAAAGVKTNGFDLSGDDKPRDTDSDSRLQSPALAAEISFAATVRDVQANGAASSIQSQAISQIIAQAENLPGSQMRSVRLRLRPAELGQIDIQLSRDAAGRISAHISAERESARGVLSRSIDQLRETLSRAGLTVDKLQISAGPGLFAGNRETDDAQSNTRESPSGVASVLPGNDTEAGGQPHAESAKLLSLHA